MSAIAGVVYREPVPETILRGEEDGLKAALRASGPAGLATWRGEGALLIHAHLRTVAEPVHNLDGDGRFLLVGDVRLDNPAELAAALGFSATSTASSIVIAAFARWGEGCCEHFLGDFAFALWDRSERSLFCARDHFGVRPLYLRDEPTRLMFASDARALTGGVCRGDAAHIGAFLTGVVEDATTTADSRITRLPPGHRLVRKGDCTRISRYWTLEPETPPRPSEVVEAFRERFETAVRCRLAGPAKTGALLSGGLDSSSICAVAAAKRGDALTAFSLVYPGTPETDEKRFIDAVVHRSRLRSIQISGDEIPPLYGFDELVGEGADLLNAPGGGKMRRLFEAVAADNVEVVLDGHGGDEVVWHGTRRVIDLAREGSWARLVAQLPGLSRVAAEDPWRMFFSVFNAHGPRHRMGRGIRKAGRFYERLRGLSNTARRPDGLHLLSQDFIRATQLDTRIAAVGRSGSNVGSVDDRAHADAILSPRTPAAFEALGRISSNLGIEVRYPFFDKRLVAFTLGLPSSEKLRAGWTRSVLRRAMKDDLPDEVRWRRDKIDFGSVLKRGLLAEHRPLLDDMTTDREGLLAPFYDMAALRALITALIRDPTRVSSAETMMLWRGASLFLWLRDRRPEIAS